MKALPGDQAPKTKSVGILGFNGVSILDLSGPLEAFAAARTDVDADKVRVCYDARIIAVHGKTFVSASNLTFTSFVSRRPFTKFDRLKIDPQTINHTWKNFCRRIDLRK